jgi:hypothetical protein
MECLMAIEPHVFVCYGRPDKDAAYALGHEFWKNRVECYNYLAKPVEDRLGAAELDHRSFLRASRLFVALLSSESSRRDLVAEELQLAALQAELSGGLFCRCRAYVLTTTSDSMLDRFPEPDLLFTSHRLGDVAGLVREMIEHMGPEFADRAGRAWQVNRDLYPEAWAKLDAMYAAAPKRAGPAFTPGRHSVFGDERQPTVGELKELGRSQLNRLWQDVAKRRDQLRRRYGDGESFLAWSLQRDRELIEAALRELDAEERGPSS